MQTGLIKSGEIDRFDKTSLHRGYWGLLPALQTIDLSYTWRTGSNGPGHRGQGADEICSVDVKPDQP